MKHLQPITQREMEEMKSEINAEYNAYVTHNNFFKGVCIAGLATNLDTVACLGFAGIALEYLKKGSNCNDYIGLVRIPGSEQDRDKRTI